MIPEEVACSASWQAQVREKRLSPPTAEPHHQAELDRAISRDSPAISSVVSDNGVSGVVLESMVVVSWSLV